MFIFSIFSTLCIMVGNGMKIFKTVPFKCAKCTGCQAERAL